MDFLKIFVLLAFIIFVVSAQDTGDDVPPPPVSEVEPNYGNELNRYENADMLLVSWVPYPIDKWDYVTVNISDPEIIKESGRIQMSYFTRQAFPDVGIVLTCASGDRDYFYNYDLDVPIIGVEPFDEDGVFQLYLDHIYSIHGFQNLAEMWAHFIRFQYAFVPVITRLSEQFQSYLSQWEPRPVDSESAYYTDEIDPRKQGRSGTGRRFVASRRA